MKLYKDNLFDVKVKELYNVIIISDKYIFNIDLKCG